MDPHRQSAIWRTEFLSLISHEIRTPLTTIIAFSQMLQSDNDDISTGERRNYLSIIEKESKRISRFLGELIEVSNFESSPEYLNIAECDYSYLIQSIVNDFNKDRNVHVVLNIPDTKITARLDKNRMQDAINVLLAYMTKNYSGSVEVLLNIKDCVLVTTIRRSADPISEKDRHELFDVNRQFLLTKASLSIKEKPVYAAVIIRAHEGHIHATSSPGHGLSITFDLPCF